jgi:PEP-CTERM motif-containing protein
MTKSGFRLMALAPLFLTSLQGAATSTSTTLFITCAVSAVNQGSDGAGCANLNQLYNSDNYGNSGISGYAYANLSAGTMGILSTGNVDPSSGPINNDFVYAVMGDTITAAGPAAGLNLGVNLTVNGTTSYSDPSQNVTFLAIWVVIPGTFDTTDFTAPQQELFTEGFTLGNGTGDYTQYFSDFGIHSYGGHYGDGTNTIPLNIPFATLGNNFQILVALETYEGGGDASTGYSWSTDYSHTLTVSLTPPAGVTLQSGSGVFPGASTPEPVTMAMAALALCGLAWRRRVLR